QWPVTNGSGSLRSSLSGKCLSVISAPPWCSFFSALSTRRYGDHGVGTEESRPLPANAWTENSKLKTVQAVLVYSTYFGGSKNEEGNSIAVDSAGNIYVTGFTDSINFPLVNASQPAFGGGQQDAFVAKLDPSGTHVLYSTYIGGNGQDNGTSVAVDSAGNAYITGFTDSSNFPVRNPLQATNRGTFNAFVVKLDPAGAVLNSTLFGGSQSDYGSSIAIDSTGNVYVAGLCTSADIPTVNALQPSQGGGLFDAFVTKLNSAGGQIMYSTLLGGSGVDRAFRIAVDSAGSAYVTGDTDSPNFPVANGFQPANGGSADAFVSKLNPNGTALAYSTYFGGSGIDAGTAIAVDSNGSAYLAGFTGS